MLLGIVLVLALTFVVETEQEGTAMPDEVNPSVWHITRGIPADDEASPVETVLHLAAEPDALGEPAHLELAVFTSENEATVASHRELILEQLTAALNVDLLMDSPDVVAALQVQVRQDGSTQLNFGTTHTPVDGSMPFTHRDLVVFAINNMPMQPASPLATAALLLLDR